MHKDLSVTDNTSDDTNDVEIIEVKPGELIDLSEAYVDLEQEKINVLVDGFEGYFRDHKLSSKVEPYITISGSESHKGSLLEPGRSYMNSRVGVEGLFGAIKDGFIKFFRYINEFCKRIYNWIMDRIKSFFGLQKTKRQIAECEEKAESVKLELLSLFEKLGLPADIYNVEVLFERLPEGSNRHETLSFLKNSFDTDRVFINRLIDVRPKLEVLIKTIAKQDTMRLDLNKKMDGILSQYSQKIAKDDVTTADATGIINELLKAKLIMDGTAPLSAALADVAKTLYDIEVPDKKEFTGYHDLLKDVAGKSALVKKNKFTTAEVKTYTTQTLILGRMMAREESTPISLINSSNTKSPIDAKFAGSLERIGSHAGTNIRELYLSYCNQYKNWLSDINTSLGLTTRIEKTCMNLVQWLYKAETTLALYIIGDIEKIKDHFIKLRAAGVIDPTLIDRTGAPMLYVLNNTEAETCLEVFSKVGAEMVDANVKEIMHIKSAIEKLSKIF